MIKDLTFVLATIIIGIVIYKKERERAIALEQQFQLQRQIQQEDFNKIRSISPHIDTSISPTNCENPNLLD